MRANTKTYKILACILVFSMLFNGSINTLAGIATGSNAEIADTYIENTVEYTTDISDSTDKKEDLYTDKEDNINDDISIASNSNAEKVEEDELEVQILEFNGITVEGKLPYSTELFVDNIERNIGDELGVDESEIAFALDIKLEDEFENNYQPENGLDITINNLGNFEGEVLTILHNHNSNIQLVDYIEVVDGSITFNIDSLSEFYGLVQPKLQATVMDDSFVYLDLSCGIITISGKTYTGKRYDGNSTAVNITGTLTDDQKIWVYQSGGNINTGIIDDELIIPEYNSLEYGGESWGEFITDNTDVNSVITGWDSAVAVDNERVATSNYVVFNGTPVCDVVLDNIWSSYQERSAGRTKGSLSLHAGSNKNWNVNLYLKGDNRLGSIHYYSTNNTNLLSINDYENSNGTLTVANSKINDSGNYWNAAIGGSDSYDDSKGIIINSGIIYAGTSDKDDCTAIGAGGNGYGVVTINGGTVTAVCSSSGTAIGGGIGKTSYGGSADIYINGGKIYAYNFSCKSSYSQTGVKYIPSAAIGGGSSARVNGNTHTYIEINGGEIHAQSVGGTAIGGGGSADSSGGDAEIVINGGTIYANSISGIIDGNDVPAGVAIGGGTGGTKGNGGNCILDINGEDTVLVTGSIAGGRTINPSGLLGSADVTITGGTIQGQVVMSAGTSSACSFEMTGGTIDNSTKTDEYEFLMNNGGAVYVENGNAVMSGGTIQNCSADLGGVFYVKGGDVTISGDDTELINNSSEKGGVIYVEQGNVTINGGTITNNSAVNGGAIYGVGGDIIVKHGNIDENEATDGGALYLDSTIDNYCKIYGGSLSDNTATDDGGAIYITSGNLIIGVENCDGLVDDNNLHINSDLGQFHPQIHNNIAGDCGGGIHIDNQGEVHFYCGNATGNQALYKGVGKNVFMDGGEFYYYDGANIGVPRDPDLVIIGGELHNMCEDVEFIKLVYHKSNNDSTTDRLEGLADLNGYMNLPDAEYFWESTEGFRFLGWTSKGSESENKVVRNKGDYKPSGSSIKIIDTEAEGEKQGTFDGLEDETLHLYALWAPSTSKITYVDGLELVNTDLDDDSDNINPFTYNMKETPQTITISAEEVGIVHEGFNLVGWYIYQDQDKNGNWCDEIAEGIYKSYEPVYKGTKSYQTLDFTKDVIGTSNKDRKYMKYYSLSTPNSDLELTIDAMTFGDIYLVADYDIAYQDIEISLEDSSVDSNQSFVFNIKCNELAVSDTLDQIKNEVILNKLDELEHMNRNISILENGSIKLNHVPHGVYTLSTLDKWSWRYAGIESILSVDSNNIKFNAITEKKRYEWLDYSNNKLGVFN